MSVADIRKTYSVGALDETDALANPIEQFKHWLDAALASDIKEPTAVNLATSTASSRPTARMVLLKGAQDDGFIFYSNYASRKGQQLAENPYAAMTFYWDALERQVRIEGQVSKLSREASEKYFKSRPHGSQISALASPQSQVIANREVLAERVRELEQRHPENVPLPNDWGGYLLTPDLIEFWQGRPSRLHDRLRYTKDAGGWQLERLAP